MRSLDLKTRNFFSIYECKCKTLNAVATNQNLNISLRWWAQLGKSKLPRRLTRDGMVEPVSRDLVLRRDQGQGNKDKSLFS